MYRGADREAKLVEGARKEGLVTVYSSMIVDQALRPLLDGFTAKYPFMKTAYVREDPPQQLIGDLGIRLAAAVFHHHRYRIGPKPVSGTLERQGAIGADSGLYFVSEVGR